MVAENKKGQIARENGNRPFFLRMEQGSAGPVDVL